MASGFLAAALFFVAVVAFDLDIAQAAELQGMGAGAGEGAQEGDDAQQADPVLIINSGADDAERNDDADPFGRLIGIAFGGLAHVFIVAQNGPEGKGAQSRCRRFKAMAFRYFIAVPQDWTVAMTRPGKPSRMPDFQK